MDIRVDSEAKDEINRVVTVLGIGSAAMFVAKKFMPGWTWIIGMSVGWRVYDVVLNAMDRIGQKKH